MKIIGYTVGTTLPKPSLKQTDPSKGDFIKDKDVLDDRYYTETEVDSFLDEKANATNVAYINTTDNETVTDTETSSASVIVDSYLSDTSTNPVQNKVVTTKFNEVDASIGALEPLVGTTAEVTPAQVAEAVTSGRPVAITHTEAPFGSIQYCYFNVSEAMGLILSTGIFDYGGKMTIELYGSIASGEWDLVIGSVAEKDDIPDAVVNLTSASVGQTIVVDEVDANGKPTKWKAVDYQERTHWVVKGTTPIIAEQEFTFDSNAQCPLSDTLNIVSGETYVVIWDGVEYTCNCKSGSYNGYPMLYMGNDIVIGGTDNGVPFILGKLVSNGYSLIACLEPNTTHTAALYSAVVNKVPAMYLPKGIGDSKWVELLPETTLVFTNSQYQGAHNILFEPGKTYKILWNGIEYVLTASYFNLGTMAGNGLGNQAALGGTNTGEPFMLGTDVDGTALLCVELTGATSAIVSIIGEEITMIPPKYLPEGIGYEECNVILPETAAGYNSEEKFFYVEGYFPDFVIGDTYVVNWNGVKYNSVAGSRGDTDQYIGNVSLAMGEENTGEPFFIYRFGYGGILMICNDGSASVTLSITHEKIHTIPEKYLPGMTDAEPELPTVTESDNGAFLRVVNGSWTAVQLPNAEEGEF